MKRADETSESDPDPKTAMSKPPYKRRIKLIKPRLQLKLIGVFAGLSALSFLLQVLVVGRRLAEITVLLPNDGPLLHTLTPGLLTDVLIFSFGLLLPLTCAVGVLVTFRIAGPVYRFEQYLGQVERGEAQGPCRIRKGDELQDLCDQINRTMAAVIQPPGPLPAEPDEDAVTVPESERLAG